MILSSTGWVQSITNLSCCLFLDFFVWDLKKERQKCRHYQLNGSKKKKGKQTLTLTFGGILINLCLETVSKSWNAELTELDNSRQQEEQGLPREKWTHTYTSPMHESHAMLRMRLCAVEAPPFFPYSHVHWHRLRHVRVHRSCTACPLESHSEKECSVPFPFSPPFLPLNEAVVSMLLRTCIFLCFFLNIFTEFFYLWSSVLSVFDDNSQNIDIFYEKKCTFLFFKKGKFYCILFLNGLCRSCQASFK